MPRKTSPTHPTPNNSPVNPTPAQQHTLDPAPESQPEFNRQLAEAKAAVTPPAIPAHDRIHWDWPGWLPHAFLTILASEPGVGKSFTALRIAASYLDGRPWPDGARFTGRNDKVLWCEGESGHKMHRQRLRTMRFDPDEMTFLFDGTWGNFELANPEHREALHTGLASANVGLLVLDSLTGLRGHGRQARATFEFVPELVDLAGEFGVPVLVTHHLHRRPNLDRNAQPDLERLLGSPILARAARVVWLLDAPDPADPDNRRLSMVKNNLAPLADPIGVRIDARRPHFGPPPHPSLPAAAQSEEDRAVALLKDLLAHGPLPATRIYDAAQAARIAIPTLKRAKSRLRVKSNKLPGQWTWELPPD